MTDHTDTKKLIEYRPNNFPTIGDPNRFISNELDKIANSISSITAVLRLMEARMNTDGLG